MNSDCEKIKDQIADLVTGILPEAQAQIMEQHLNECAACRDYARALKDEDMLLTEFFAKIDTDMTNRQERLLQTVNRSCLSKKTDTLLIRRLIMKSPITKLAVAAVIIVVVVLGLVELIDTGSKSGVVWADVAQKVEASSGVIFRVRKTGSGDPNDQWPKGYTVMQRNATLSRTDWYRGDQIHRTVYFDLVGKTKIWVAHDASVYSKETMSDEETQKMRADGLGWTNPQGLINRGLTREHHKLGQKTIDGVLCEGIETNDAGDDVSNFPVKSFSARLWVSVETGYPVLLEIEVIGGDDGSIRHTSMGDQFQWNVDLSAEDVEPEIPADYEPLE